MTRADEIEAADSVTLDVGALRRLARMPAAEREALAMADPEGWAALGRGLHDALDTVMAVAGTARHAAAAWNSVATESRALQ